MMMRNYKSVKDMPKNMRVIWYVAMLSTFIGAVLLVINMFELGDTPLYIPMAFIAMGSLINSAVICGCKDLLKK
ncbi:MAG: hypothetical protein J5476_13865 [Lachnospiraceae bacterium]|nr:hypothetical protein [Lachnospiraceae bacterium]